MTKKETLKWIVQLVASIATAILTALGATSCLGVRAQRIYPVGKAWLIKNKVVPLQHGSYPIASSHPS